MNSKQHLTELLNKDLHKDGACVIRHNNAQHPKCRYEKNGFEVTTTGRKADYKVKLARTDVEGLRLRVPKNVKEPTPARPGVKLGKGQAATTLGFDEDMWNVGAKADGLSENFKPRKMGGRGFHYPYLHNWHHLIASEMLYSMLYSEKHGTRLLQVVLVAKYNLNGKENIALLPKQEAVGQLVKWPVHPNSHPGFDEYAEKKLGWLQDQLVGALGKGTAHEVNPENVGNVKSDLDAISGRLYKILRLARSRGIGGHGKHINEINSYGAGIEERLGPLKLAGPPKLP